ncbi:MAG: peptidylprolyl isomerase [Defluviitaleaceae bacterium]|nr:peptidylprolyl isomerase [Defluviitaleaceae bacterium]
MKKKNANNRPQLKRTSKPVQKPSIKTIDQKWFMIGAVVLVAVVIFTAGLVWFYNDTVVARASGIRIRESEVAQEIVRNANLQQMLSFNMMTWEEVSEEAARQLAFTRLFENYANNNNISIEAQPFQEFDGFTMGGVQTLQDVRDTVTFAIISTPELFAEFEAYMPEDEIPYALSRAEAILARLANGEDFDTLMATYSEDPGLVTSPDGYVFLEGAMVPEFFTATNNLEIGEISGLVQTIHGFHIVMRIDPPEHIPIMLPGGHQVPQPFETEDEIFGAKHILIMAQELTYDQRMATAVIRGFEAKLDNADLTFTRGINNIPR